MPRPEKAEKVKELKDRLETSDAAILAEFRGLKVTEMKELRRKLAEGGAEFRVVKNTLTRLAVREADLEALLPLVEGSTAITFVKGDPVVAAKGLDEMARKYPALVVKGGLVEGRVVNAERAQALARVKPREELLAELAGLFQAPIQRLAYLFSAPVRNLGYALGAYRAKLEEEEGPAGAAAVAPEPDPAAGNGAAAEKEPAEPEASSGETDQAGPEAPATGNQVTEESPTPSQEGGAEPPQEEEGK
jgi:large subunit ribosomal protein L10